METEELRKEQTTVMFHPEILQKIDERRSKMLWTRSQFIEEATKKLLKELEKLG